MDDYLHVIDTALWLAGGKIQLLSGILRTDEQGEMYYAEHHFRTETCMLTTRMHRHGGSDCEVVQALTEGKVYEVRNMTHWQEARGGKVIEQVTSTWQALTETRGFAGCARHFIESVLGGTQPETSGEQALMAQRVIDHLWRQATLE